MDISIDNLANNYCEKFTVYIQLNLAIGAAYTGPNYYFFIEE